MAGNREADSVSSNSRRVALVCNRRADLVIVRQGSRLQGAMLQDNASYIFPLVGGCGGMVKVRPSVDCSCFSKEMAMSKNRKVARLAVSGLAVIMGVRLGVAAAFATEQDAQHREAGDTRESERQMERDIKC